MKRNFYTRLLRIGALATLIASLGWAALVFAQNSQELQEANEAQYEIFDQARDALNDSRYRTAVKLFQKAYTQDPNSELAGECLYWQAFSLYRKGARRDLKKAAELLELQIAEFKQARTTGEAHTLAARIDGELANQGDHRAARHIHEHLEAEIRAQQEHGEQVHRIHEAYMREHQEHMSHQENHAHEQLIHEQEHLSHEIEHLEHAQEGQMHRGHLDHHESEKVAALSALARMDSERALPILEDILKDHEKHDTELVRSAIFILGRTELPEAERILLDLLDEDLDPELIAQVTLWLAGGESQQSQRAVMDLISDEDADETVRCRAIVALSRHQPKGIEEFLVETFEQTENDEVRTSLLFAIARFDEGIPASWYLNLINETNIEPELHEQLMYIASRRGILNVDELVGFYRDADTRDAKRRICYLLSQLENERSEALTALFDIVEDETDPAIRADAVFWIGHFNDPRAINFLENLMDE